MEILSGITTFSTTGDERVKFPKIFPSPYAYCDYFTIGNTVNGASAMYGRTLVEMAQYYNASGTYESSMTIYINTKIDNTTDLNTFLTNNNVKYYNTAYIPTYTLLNDTLQTQLEDIYNAQSYIGQTNILQENNDLPFNLIANALEM